MYKNQDFQLEIGWEIRSISYLGLWESMNNKNFKGGKFATFKKKQVVINLNCLHKNGSKN